MRVALSLEKQKDACQVCVRCLLSGVKPSSFQQHFEDGPTFSGQTTHPRRLIYGKLQAVRKTTLGEILVHALWRLRTEKAIFWGEIRVLGQQARDGKQTMQTQHGRKEAAKPPRHHARQSPAMVPSTRPRLNVAQ